MIPFIDNVIDPEKCEGCGKCVEVCCGHCIELRDN